MYYCNLATDAVIIIFDILRYPFLRPLRFTLTVVQSADPAAPRASADRPDRRDKLNPSDLTHEGDRPIK